MLKPDLLRQMISQHVPWLRENPDNLAVYLRKGRMVSTGQRAAAFEYRYTLEVLVMDYLNLWILSACRYWHGRVYISLICYLTRTGSRTA